MPTFSNSRDFDLTCIQVIRSAMEEAGVIEVGETPPDTEYRAARQLLNRMLKGWQNKNIGLWCSYTATLFLEYNGQVYELGTGGDHCTSAYLATELDTDASEGDTTISVSSDTGIADTYNIGIRLDDNTRQWTTADGDPASGIITLDNILDGDAESGNSVYAYASKITRPKTIETAFLTQGPTDTPSDSPITFIGKERYDGMSSKTVLGKAAMAYFDPQYPLPKLWVWPTCDNVDDHIRLRVQSLIQDLDDLDDNLQLPPEWLDAIVLNLAVRLAKINGHIPRAAMLKPDADEAFKDARRADTPDTGISFMLDIDT